jgi:hypothetical protein
MVTVIEYKFLIFNINQANTNNIRGWTKDWANRTPIKPGDELRCSGKGKQFLLHMFCFAVTGWNLSKRNRSYYLKIYINVKLKFILLLIKIIVITFFTGVERKPRLNMEVERIVYEMCISWLQYEMCISWLQSWNSINSYSD